MNLPFASKKIKVELYGLNLISTPVFGLAFGK